MLHKQSFPQQNSATYFSLLFPFCFRLTAFQRRWTNAMVKPTPKETLERVKKSGRNNIKIPYFFIPQQKKKMLSSGALCCVGAKLHCNLHHDAAKYIKSIWFSPYLFSLFACFTPRWTRIVKNRYKNAGSLARLLARSPVCLLYTGGLLFRAPLCSHPL